MSARLRPGLAVIGLLALASAASPAAAQDSGFARSGVLAIGVDRLFGVLRMSMTAENAAETAESTTSITEVSLLSSGGGVSPYALPRAAIDGFVTDGVSIGGMFGVVSQSIDSEVEAGNMSRSADGPSGLGILFGGRVGYGHMFTDVVGIWPKLGLSFFSNSLEDPDDDTEVSVNGLALSADVALLISPVPHFGFTIAPVLDLGLTGSTETEVMGTEGAETDTTITDFGLQLGLLGWI